MKIKILFNHGGSSKPVASAPRKRKRTFTVSRQSTAIVEEGNAWTAAEKPPSGAHRAASRLHSFIFPSTPNLEWGKVPPLRYVRVPTVARGESGGLIKEKDQSVLPPKEPENAELPWNLRRKRALSKVESSKPAPDKSSKPAAAGAPERKEKRKLTVPLSFEEIEADFLLMTGKKPHRRPKKRPRHVQKEVDHIVPGVRLSTVTLDMYKVVV